MRTLTLEGVTRTHLERHRGAVFGDSSRGDAFSFRWVRIPRRLWGDSPKSFLAAVDEALDDFLDRHAIAVSEAHFLCVLGAEVTGYDGLVVGVEWEQKP